MTQLLRTQVYDKSRDAIIDMIGINLPFDSPYYIFFSAKELFDESEPEIYFMGYQMKASGASFWGYINRSTQNIVIDDSCTYKVQMLMDMLKQWKRNNFILSATSTTNRISANMEFIYQYKDEKNYFENFQKAMISYFYRSEMEEKDIPKDVDRNLLKKIISSWELKDENDILVEMYDIDSTMVFVERRDNKLIKFSDYYSYARFKAYYALCTGKITQAQFDKLYPWPYTTNIINRMIYDFNNMKLPVLSEIEENLETGNFAIDYPKEFENFLIYLNTSLKFHEDSLNLTTPDNNAKSDKIQKWTNLLLNSIQERRIKISPVKQCPFIKECYGREEEEECKIYNYPEGFRVEHLD